MITLNASGGSVSFTFSGNSTYLNDGTITVPVNSLALIIDESDMATFRKSASNDIFVSANIAEFGMTKDELIAWFKANAVGSTGGGGGGVTPSEVQTMIDESISGKADSSAVTEEISAAVSGYADAVAYDSNTKAVKFYHGGTGGTEVYNFDASPFLIDGMVQNVEIKSVEISGVATTCLVISFNTDAGKQDINIPISQIFDASNYYTTAQTDSAISAAISGKQDTLIAGRGISITTGETADTVSFNLPISAGTGTNSIIEGDAANNASGRLAHAEGQNTTASGRFSHAEGNGTAANGNGAHTEGDSTSATSYAHAEGRYTSANGLFSHAEGYYTQTHNQSEHASGNYNVSNTGSTNADKTLFSVGNGTAEDARHNAFEIRQNGDIYFTKDGQDVKLQDHLGGLTSGEVQTMIDESISGKIDASISSASTNAVQNQVLFDELRILSGESEVETTLIWSGSDWKTTTNYPSGCTEFKLNCEGISSDVFIDFNGNNGLIGYIRISDLQIAQSSFEEGVVNYTVSGDVMTISYPTLTNVVSLGSGTGLENKVTVNTIETIYTPLIDQVSANTIALSGKADTSYVDSAVSGKADSSDVYTKSEVDNAITAATDDMATETWVGEQGYITGVDLSNYATTAYVDGAVSGKVETSAITSAVTSGSTDSEIPTAKAVYDYIDAKFAELLAIIQDNEEVTAQALNDLNNAINNN